MIEIIFSDVKVLSIMKKDTIFATEGRKSHFRFNTGRGAR